MMGRVRTRFAPPLAALLLASVAASTHAASMPYPNQGPIPPGITFTNIVESSGTDAVPLYGLPVPTFVGLAFPITPTFNAMSAGGVDFTDGQLNFTVNAGPGAGGIPLVGFSEGGAYLLGGVGAGTYVSAGAVIHATVTAINGVGVTPVPLPSSTAGVTYTLPANLAGTWNLSAAINVAAELAALGFGPGQLATSIDVVVDNLLTAASLPGATAQIRKTEFDIILTPEPATAAMLAFGICGMGLGRSRRRSS